MLIKKQNQGAGVFGIAHTALYAKARIGASFARRTGSARPSRLLVVAVLLAVALLLVDPVIAGSPDDPEIVDPTGDTQDVTADIRKVWFQTNMENGPGFLDIHMELGAALPEIDLGTCGVPPNVGRLDYGVYFDLLAPDGNRLFPHSNYAELLIYQACVYPRFGLVGGEFQSVDYEVYSNPDDASAVIVWSVPLDSPHMGLPEGAPAGYVVARPYATSSGLFGGNDRAPDTGYGRDFILDGPQEKPLEVRIHADPSESEAVPGSTAEFDLQVINDSDVNATLALEGAADEGLEVSLRDGPDVVLTAGATLHTQAMVHVNATLRANTTHNFTLFAYADGAGVADTTFTVHVVEADDVSLDNDTSLPDGAERGSVPGVGFTLVGALAIVFASFNRFRSPDTASKRPRVKKAIIVAVCFMLAVPVAGYVAASGPEAGMEGASDGAQPPQEIAINATFLLANFVSTDWAQAAEFLPEGFTPRSPPDIPVNGNCFGLADQAVAIVLVWVFEYDSASVDGQPLPGGLLAVAYVPTEPPEQWDYRPYPGQLCNGQSGRVWIGAVATEPGMAAALSSWGIDAGVGEVTMDHIDAGAYVATVASSEGGPLEFTTIVQTTAVALTNDHNSVVAYYLERDNQVFPMFDHQPRYKYAAGANLFTGELGDFGSLTGVPSVASRIWFGLGNSAPAGDVGVWRYYLVDPPAGP